MLKEFYQQKTTLERHGNNMHNNNKRIIILTLTFIFLLAVLQRNAANANVDMYAHCIKGYQFSDNQIQSLVLSPLNRTCQVRCEHECNGFSRKLKNSIDENEEGVELNSNIITECMSSCQSGILFKSYYYEAKPRQKPEDDPEIEIKAPVSIGSACQEGKEWVINNAARTGFYVSHGEKIKVRMAGTQKKGSKVYLCGKKEIHTLPIFPNINDIISTKTPYNFNTSNATWEDDKKQSAWKKRTDHMCLMQLSEDEFYQLNNKLLWNFPPWSLASAEKPKPENDLCNWSARSKVPIDTGLAIQDGDELTIRWYGSYASQYNGKIYDRKNIVECMYNTTLPQASRDLCKKFWRENSALYISDQNGIDKHILFGEDARNTQDIRSSLIYSASQQTQSTPYKWHGLQGSASDVNLKMETNESIPGCPKKDDQDESSQDGYNNPECIKILHPGTADYLFNGKVDGLFNTRSRLFISHPQIFPNSLGGYGVDIGWGGCIFENGKRVQYAVMSNEEFHNANSKVPDSEWKDVPESVFTQYEELVINSNKSGMLFFRIKPLEAPQGLSPEIQDLYSNPANYFGQYYLLIEAVSQSTAIVKDGPITKLLRIIIEQMLGKGRQIGETPTKGVVYNIFSSISQNTAFQKIIYTLILAYISFTGVGLLIGVIELHQQEVIKRLVKLGLVVTAISPNSWEFFGGFIVPFFIDGATSLIAQILSASVNLGGTEITEENLLKDPLIIFTIFDGPFQQIFSVVVWKKIAGILLTNSLGLIIVIFILLAMFYYVLMIIKASIMYVFSVLMSSLLIIMGPIFIPMILFKKTYSLFDSWCKQLFSFLLQPVMTFAAIAIFNLLIIAVLQSTLNFTVCPNCFLYLYIPLLYSDCIIPGYSILMTSHLPDGASSFASIPMFILSGSLAIFLVSQGAYGFCGFIGSLASTIATGSTPDRLSTVEGMANNVMGAPVNAAKAAVNTAVEAYQKGKSAKGAGAGAKGKDVVKRSDAAKLAGGSGGSEVIPGAGGG